MSHDIKTPLSGILGLCEILLTRTQDAVQAEFIQSISTTSAQLLAFFDNCLELSKFENDDIALISEQFSIHCLVHDVVELFKAPIHEKSLSLSICYDSSVPDILISSRPALFRILQNILGNAIKFTNEGSIKITVNSSLNSVYQQRALHLSIEDTGIGILKKNQRIIFEKFTRLSPSYKGIYTGAGNGLYITKKLLDTLNGKIKVQSTVGVGSKFSIELPINE